MTETLILAALVIPCLMVAIVFHEVSHGYAALALGDPTAKEQRRLSLNPIRHVDVVGTLIVPMALWLFGGPIFGWAKPVPVRKDRLDNPRYGMMAVAAAGPASNLVLATIGAIILGLIVGYAPEPLVGLLHWVAQAMQVFILINIFLALFNLLPIPPFDGSHILEGLLPRSVAKHFAQFQKVGMLFIVGLVALTWIAPESGIVENVVLPPVDWTFHQFARLANFVAGY